MQNTQNTQNKQKLDLDVYIKLHTEELYIGAQLTNDNFDAFEE